MNLFCVYEHWRSDKNECFYVGKGKWRRAFDMATRNDRHKKITAKVKSLGGSIEIRLLSLYMTEDAALLFEIERIAYWRSMGTELANICDGGQGTSGASPSAEARAKMRLAKLGKKRNPESVRKAAEKMRGHRCYTAGKPLSEETKRKISEAHKGNQYVKGYKLTPEQKTARSAAMKGVPRGIGKVLSSAHREAIGRASKERWGDPEFRAKMDEINKKVWQRRKESVAA